MPFACPWGQIDGPGVYNLYFQHCRRETGKTALPGHFDLNTHRSIVIAFLKKSMKQFELMGQNFFHTQKIK